MTLAESTGHGPLAGLRVIEIGGLGPAPFAAMMLADLGAEVVRVDRPGPPPIGPESMQRGKRSIVLDLRQAAGTEALLELAARADVLIEGFRPGVMERLGLGPAACHARNPRLVYGRMTGWGQSGPRSAEAGHDIGHITLTGALHAIGPAEGGPLPPLALVGDLGGGGMFLVTGILAALFEASRSGQGQVVDAAIVDGAAALMGPIYGMLAQGAWVDRRASNWLDGAAPWYRTYRTADGRWLAVGSIEGKFWDEFARTLGLATDNGARMDPRNWPALGETIAAVIATRPLAEWEAVFAGGDACVAPVRSMSDAPSDPHLAARGTFIEIGGTPQPAPAPRFDRTPAALPAPPAALGADTRAVLEDWSIPHAAALLADGVAIQRD